MGYRCINIRVKNINYKIADVSQFLKVKKRTFIKLLVKYVPIILFVFNIKLFQLVYTWYAQGMAERVYTQFVCEFFYFYFDKHETADRGELFLRLPSTLLSILQCLHGKIIKFSAWNILSEIKESVFCVIFNKDLDKI